MYEICMRKKTWSCALSIEDSEQARPKGKRKS